MLLGQTQIRAVGEVGSREKFGSERMNATKETMLANRSIPACSHAGLRFNLCNLLRFNPHMTDASDDVVAGLGAFFNRQNFDGVRGVVGTQHQMAVGYFHVL